MTYSLKRIAPGRYVTLDGNVSVFRTEEGSRYWWEAATFIPGDGWVIDDRVLGPTRTLMEMRRQLAARER